ncbi:hypothetical protein F5984_20470 [Rudanella paleaurantiibacter]|uniref:Uncharacterized protein n=1 Tax=Rudanella paleaurantiibacter TaxID=2614655 RepID=A0A7J5TW15_9BACT|nr:hypothetical protein [Rudanella paleaurantiibacter]KAB7728123.1 hypothetical protein F5984_20470 [Rudanella paleaurantiibacter]
MKALLYLVIASFLGGCMTFEKARRRYSTTEIDTVYQTISTVVPRDSAVLRVVTDTTTVVREIRQGRARIIYERNPRTTTIKANCDSVFIEKKVPVVITKQVWGIDPKWKERAEDAELWVSRWRTAAFVLLGLILSTLAAIWFLRTFTVSINRKKPISK